MSRWLEQAVQDARFGARTLARNRGLTRSEVLSSALLLLLLIVSALTPQRARGQSLRVEEMTSPAGPNSQAPNLTSGDGAIWMTWVEKPAGTAPVLRFARRERDGWSAPGTIASRPRLLVNWADIPGLAVLGKGRLAAWWLEKGEERGHVYGVRIARSVDGGKSWGDTLRPHPDGPGEYGFVSIVPSGGERFVALWLDGRNAGHGRGETTLRAAEFDGSGFTTDRVVDPRVCDCCPTSAVATPGGAVVAYRDRGADELRDISFSTMSVGGWTTPGPVHADGWRIPACPVNGPSLAAKGERLVAAWFTVSETPKVFVAFGRQGGAFSTPVRVDDGNPAGRAAIVLLDGESALVTWIERRAQSGAEIRARAVAPDGTRAASFAVAETTSARTGGFPRMARAGSEILVAWTDAAQEPRVRVARIGR